MEDDSENQLPNNITKKVKKKKVAENLEGNCVVIEKKQKEKKSVKPIPGFKKIPGTEFLVDAFTYKNEECHHYFLTHFHSDHYAGITKGWHHGTIYCSFITAKLVILKLGVQEEYVIPIPMDEEVDILNTKVCFMDANHCPGAAIILFKVNGKNILHTGDFRFDSKMKTYPQLHHNKIDVLYLDNTFCDAKYTFPPQAEIIREVANIVKKEISLGALILIGTYVIGKERILIEAAKKSNQKIYVTTEKLEILKCLDLDISIFTVYPSDTPIHAVSMAHLNFKRMNEMYNVDGGTYSRVVGIIPTGWSQARAPISRKDYGKISIITAAYSEHSSYNELLDCVSWLRPAKIVPTVDCNTPDKVKSILAHFDGKTDNSQNYSTLIPYLSFRSPPHTPTSSSSASTPISSISDSSVDVNTPDDSFDFTSDLFVNFIGSDSQDRLDDNDVSKLQRCGTSKVNLEIMNGAEKNISTISKNGVSITKSSISESVNIVKDEDFDMDMEFVDDSFVIQQMYIEKSIKEKAIRESHTSTVITSGNDYKKLTPLKTNTNTITKTKASPASNTRPTKKIKSENTPTPPNAPRQSAITNFFSHISYSIFGSDKTLPR